MTLKEKLDYHYKKFDRKSISPDPLEFLHKYTYEDDIEAAGIISSVFAYGNVTSIKKTLTDIFHITSNPGEFIRNASGKEITSFTNIFYRFYSPPDIQAFFLSLKNFYRTQGSVKDFFYKYYMKEEPNLRSPMITFSDEMYKLLLKYRKEESTGIKFMFPSPASGSACKRMNLFLRWMIRKDELDFGLYTKITPSKLLIPVDTHIAKICRRLKLTSLNNVSWRMAVEITENLKKYSSDDPVKYDFAICHIGIRKEIF